jgi:hypothetical protein
MRYANVHLLIPAYDQVRLFNIEQGFFEEKHATLCRKPGHQMLWSLKDEIPPQVREAN